MRKVVALVPVNLDRTFLGLPSLVAERFGVGASAGTVLESVVRRVSRVEGVGEVVLVHPGGQDPAGLVRADRVGKAVRGFAFDAEEPDPWGTMRASGRKWALGSWRGGLGGMTCYDELLPAGPLAAAMRAHEAESALVVGGDWVLVDPGYCERVLAHHLENHDAMQMTFCQAPPGLAGVAVGREFVEQLSESGSTFGRVLAYNPARPQADPIGRDVCVQVEASVRSCAQRFVYDTRPSAAMLDWVAERLGDGVGEAGAAEVVRLASGVDDQTAGGFAALPQQVTLELTPRRGATGPITPHRYTLWNRPDMAEQMAVRLVEQMGDDGDVALTLGGLGDALLHGAWERVVEAAHAAGVLGITVETDLLVDDGVVDRLMGLPVDVVSVRLNADTAKTYASVMGVEAAVGADKASGFEGVVRRLQRMLEERAERLQGAGGYGQWVVPRLVKTPETLGDMETFFDRWVHVGGHAVIEPATTGCGLMPDQSPVSMAPPRRFGCRQVEGRMSILSDGRVAQCGQDWLGRGRGGDATVTPLAEIWRAMRPVREAHAEGRWEELELCGACSEWHRP